MDGAKIIPGRETSFLLKFCYQYSHVFFCFIFCSNDTENKEESNNALEANLRPFEKRTMELSWPVAGACIFPNVGGFVSSYLFNHEIKTWYETLKRPSWRPPNAAFGPIWTTLYSGMGYASYLVWKDGGGFDGPARIPLILYGTQLGLNWAWSPIFFGAHKIKWALVDLSLLYGASVACAYYFYKINPTAGLMMIPYLGWLSVAMALNYCIYRDNPEQKS